MLTKKEPAPATKPFPEPHSNRPPSGFSHDDMGEDAEDYGELIEVQALVLGDNKDMSPATKFEQV